MFWVIRTSIISKISGNTLRVVFVAHIFTFPNSIFITTQKNLSFVLIGAGTLLRCSPLWFHSSRNHRFQDGVEMMFAGAGIFFPMLFDELRNLVFLSGFFEIYFFHNYLQPIINMSLSLSRTSQYKLKP